MANANTAGEVSLPQSQSVSKVLMRVFASSAHVFFHAQNRRSCGASALSSSVFIAVIF